MSMKKPLQPPDWRKLLVDAVKDDPNRLLKLIPLGSAVDYKGRYLHWDQMRYRQPPDGLSLHEWWAVTRWTRDAQARTLPFAAASGRHFRLTIVDQIQEATHRIDQRASGNLAGDVAITTVGSKDHYLVASLVEEAITSSLLEGAATTRRAAKSLLRQRRPPRSHAERMVLNNFRAMLNCSELAQSGEPLTPQDVMELHRVVTAGTLRHESDVGRLQQAGEERVQVVWGNGQVLHHPPPAEQLPERLEQLCAFANGQLGDGFLHPVIRSVLLHFWIGYDHPFVDGNGRTARALFYWLMLRSGYWLAEYISISAVLRKAPAQYVRSYLYTQTDSEDVTYFVLHQLRTLERAIDDLETYLRRKTREIKAIEDLLQGVTSLNHRQLGVIGKALRDPDATFTIAGHQDRHRVVYQSARADLLALEVLGLFKREKVSRHFEFTAVTGLRRKLKELAARSTT